MLWQLYDYKGTINSFYHKQIHFNPTRVRRNMYFPRNKLKWESIISLDGFSSPPQLRIKQKEFTEEWNLRISSNLFHRWEKTTLLVSTLFVAIMAFTSDFFLQKLMDKPYRKWHMDTTTRYDVASTLHMRRAMSPGQWQP